MPYEEMVAAGKENSVEFCTEDKKNLFQSRVLLLISPLNVFFYSSVTYFLFKLLFCSSNAVF
jgi:hypothetical protein